MPPCVKIVLFQLDELPQDKNFVGRENPPKFSRNYVPHVQPSQDSISRFAVQHILARRKKTLQKIRNHSCCYLFGSFLLAFFFVTAVWNWKLCVLWEKMSWNRGFCVKFPTILYFFLFHKGKKGSVVEFTLLLDSNFIQDNFWFFLVSVCATEVWAEDGVSAE